ncbi:metallophosphoesterase [Bacillus sp. PS06]|uniref:metallophosphoesterase n=1 Tax=Bacillus sp. PS06 TaxID=2764176 RepID=UPI001783FC34|nr:metallophosphoesterase [Bacillus sp. PS06]MBD8069695.1 metallophosphoesterase [Bacillus sp. PS06]
MIEVKKLQLDKNKRIIVISDIHGNIKLFKKLLDQLNYTEEDYLFINGDLCEKGPSSLNVVQYVRQLTQKSDHVYVTKGNCDILYRYVFKGVDGIISYMKKQNNSILNEMLQQHNRSIDDFHNIEAMTDFYQQHFKDELEWLESLPVAYETEEFIIIHAGIDDLDNWHHTSEEFALSTPSFYEKEHHAHKNVIVGHWPAINYRSNQDCSNNPLIDLNKKIIAIDGGNQIKTDGQLNALIIENDKYSTSYVDELSDEIDIAKTHVDSTRRTGAVTYPNYEMKMMDEEEFFTYCENTRLGIQQWIKNEYLELKDNMTYCKDDLSTTFLSVNEGEKVKVIDNECSGYVLIKRSNGEVGWIPREVIRN